MYKKLITWALLWLTAASGALADNDFLRVDQAFVISAQAGPGNSVRVNWQIADGYYMYKSKFRFTTDTPGVELDTPRLPPALPMNDPIFGPVEIYRDQVTIEVPFAILSGNVEILTLKARSQGCADAGLCYPPTDQTVLVALDQGVDAPPPVDPNAVQEFAPAGSVPPQPEAEPEPEPVRQPAAAVPAWASAEPSGNALGELTQLGQSFGLGIEEDDILAPEEAFQVTAGSTDGSRVQVRWTIAPETYLYADKLALSLRGDGVQLGEFRLPPPEVKKDSIKPDGSIGDVEVYHDLIDLDIPLVRSNTDATEVELTVKYQGCAERGICYPPQQQVFALALPAAEGATTVAAAAPVASSAAPAVKQSEQDQIADMLRGGSTWLVVGVFFLIGLGLAFTPCVFPMIPILSGIITGQGSSITTRKAFTLSLAYVLAMALTYTVAGIFAALAGENLQAMLQNPIALTVFALVFVALAMSMFGFYELQLPSGLQSRLAEISNRQKGGSVAGAAVMGLLSALIVGPCVAPPLAGALIYIGQTGDAVLGGLALFAMSMGMGVPLIAIGTSAGKLLPRAGAWMDTVKAVFGVTMLAVAIYLLERVISPVTAMFLWGTLLIVSGVYMGALSQLPEGASGWRRLWKGLGLVLVIYGGLFLVGVAADGKNTLQPLRGLAVGGGSAAEAKVEFRPVKTIEDLDRELAAAKAAGKPVMLDFYADWCVYCIQMERDTFPDPVVQRAFDQMILLKADVTANDEADKALQRHMGVAAPPAMIFWDDEGNEIRHLRLLGFKGPGDFAVHLNEVLKE